MKNKINYKLAFSLAEMMVVMLILSIVLAAAAPIITRRVIAGENFSDAIPSGVIVIWKGSVVTIPDGWHLCDGTNGTPDLRSRFVYGAGGDTTTKASVVTGWNADANGHWAIGFTGGEEYHTLIISEIPSHSHTGYTDVQGNHSHPLPTATALGADSSMGAIWGKNVNGSYAPYTGNHSHNVYTYAIGGGNSHNILPRFYVLAYIMKL